MLNQADLLVNSLGALLSGLAAVVSAWLGYRSAAKRHDSACEQRLKEVREAMMLGMGLEKRDNDEHEERWSHLP